MFLKLNMHLAYLFEKLFLKNILNQTKNLFGKNHFGLVFGREKKNDCAVDFGTVENIS